MIWPLILAREGLHHNSPTKRLFTLVWWCSRLCTKEPHHWISQKSSNWSYTVLKSSEIVYFIQVALVKGKQLLMSSEGNYCLLKVSCIFQGLGGLSWGCLFNNELTCLLERFVSSSAMTPLDSISFLFFMFICRRNRSHNGTTKQ